MMPSGLCQLDLGDKNSGSCQSGIVESKICDDLPDRQSLTKSI